MFVTAAVTLQAFNVRTPEEHVRKWGYYRCTNSECRHCVVHGPAVWSPPPPPRKEPPYPGNRRLGGPHNRNGFLGENMSLLPLTRIKRQLLGHQNVSLFTIPWYSGCACSKHVISVLRPYWFIAHKSHTCTFLAGMETEEDMFRNLVNKANFLHNFS